MKDFFKKPQLRASLPMLCMQEVFNAKFQKTTSVSNAGFLYETCVGGFFNGLFLGNGELKIETRLEM